MSPKARRLLSETNNSSPSVRRQLLNRDQVINQRNFFKTKFEAEKSENLALKIQLNKLNIQVNELKNMNPQTSTPHSSYARIVQKPHFPTYTPLHKIKNGQIPSLRPNYYSSQPNQNNAVPHSPFLSVDRPQYPLLFPRNNQSSTVPFNPWNSQSYRFSQAARYDPARQKSLITNNSSSRVPSRIFNAFPSQTLTQTPTVLGSRTQSFPAYSNSFKSPQVDRSKYYDSSIPSQRYLPAQLQSPHVTSRVPFHSSAHTQDKSKYYDSAIPSERYIPAGVSRIPSQSNVQSQPPSIPSSPLSCAAPSQTFFHASHKTKSWPHPPSSISPNPSSHHTALSRTLGQSASLR